MPKIQVRNGTDVENCNKITIFVTGLWHVAGALTPPSSRSTGYEPPLYETIVWISIVVLVHVRDVISLLTARA